LRARGVASSLIDRARSAVAPEAELARARAAARRRLPALRSTDPVRTAARLRGFLMRRGYPKAIVARVLRESTGLSGEDRPGYNEPSDDRQRDPRGVPGLLRGERSHAR